MTTFTDDTNIAVAPIKSGIAPFTNSAAASGASNRVILADSFELAVPRTYFAGERIAPVWSVGGGAASVLVVNPASTNAPDGDQYVSFPDNGLVNTVVANMTLTPGQLYRVRYLVGRVAIGRPQGISVYVNGILRQELRSEALPTGWYQGSFLFASPQRDAVLEFVPPRSPGVSDLRSTASRRGSGSQLEAGTICRRSRSNHWWVNAPSAIGHSR